MINFPLFPADNEQYSFNGRSWQFSAARGVWDMIPVPTTDANFAATQALTAKSWADAAAVSAASAAAAVNRFDEVVISGATTTYVPTGGTVGFIVVSKAAAVSIQLRSRVTDPTLLLRRPFVFRLTQTGVVNFLPSPGVTVLKDNLKATSMSQPHLAVTAMMVNDTTWWLHGGLDLA